MDLLHQLQGTVEWDVLLIKVHTFLINNKRPFYSSVKYNQASTWKWGLGWPMTAGQLTFEKKQGL